MNLLTRMRRRRSLDSPLALPDSFGYFGMSRPVNGLEKPAPAEFLAIAQRVLKRNGAVAALMFIRQAVFSEARLCFRQLHAAGPGELSADGDLSILERPWPGATMQDLLSRMIQDADLAGTSFVARRPNGTLKRLRPDWVTIVTGSEEEPDLYGDALDGELLGYIYSPRAPGSEQGEVLLPGEVACFAPIPDPEFQFRGLSWITPLLGEVEADSAATEHKRNFFHNGATPRVVVSLDATVKPDMFDRFIAKFEAAHGGTGSAYRTMYLGGGADAKMLSHSLKDLDYKAVQAIGESRLAAAAGVPPVIVGFSEGLAGSSLNAGNYASSRRRFADVTMRPLWRRAAGALSHLVDVPDGAELWWNDRDVAFLREDLADIANIQAKKASTIRQLTDAGFTAASVVAAVEADDLSLLEHSGLFSVQLLPPDKMRPDAAPAAAVDSPADDEPEPDDSEQGDDEQPEEGTE
ncbi:phage portal protein [Nonomuraea sp. NPDC050451]|uniref:phage portal protein n=1 Tax=Nonomuraea sp. NPDC050451 TaxID=3364364 RepID=UPI0037B3DACD